MKNPVAFLDRDGTINVDKGFVHKISQWEFVPRAIPGLQLLQRAGYTLAIVTNQGGIAHGMYTQEDVEELHKFMLEELAKHDINIAAVTYCPHRRDQNDCGCRKPATGMARQIEAQIGEIDYSQSWMIGDKFTDLGFGQNLGIKTALIHSRYWTEKEIVLPPTCIVADLYDATEQIILRDARDSLGQH